MTLLDSQLAPWRLADQRGKVVVLSVVPSIDTRVCEAQTHHVSDAIAELPPGTVVVTVSRDLPFAQQRFAEEAHTQTVMASDAKGREFGRRFGLEVDESGLLARSTWVIDKAGTIAYRELVADLGVARPSTGDLRPWAQRGVVLDAKLVDLRSGQLLWTGTARAFDAPPIHVAPLDGRVALVWIGGYGVLLLDARGHGDSGGRAMDLGWFGDLDVTAAVDHLAARDDVDPDRIGAVGMSMGGEEAGGAVEVVVTSDGDLHAVAADEDMADATGQGDEGREERREAERATRSHAGEEVHCVFIRSVRGSPREWSSLSPILIVDAK